MRELTANLLLISLGITIIMTIIALIKMDIFSKLNLSIYDNFRIDLDMCKIKNRRWWQ